MGNNNKCRDCYNFSESLGVCKFDWTRGGNTDICDKFLPLPLEEGVKYDKGKPRLGEMIMDFAPAMTELCKVWEFGADKYSKSNWKLVDNGEDRYLNALYRHTLAAVENEYDDESKLLHCAHMIFNCMAYTYFVLRRLNGDKKN